MMMDDDDDDDDDDDSARFLNFFFKIDFRKMWEMSVCR